MNGQHVPPEYLVRLVEGLLDMARVRTVVRHLEDCRTCQASFRIIIRLKASAELIAEPPAPRRRLPAVVRRVRDVLGA